MAQAERMTRQGADILDLGGESTRPGAAPVDPAEEQSRILPVLERLLERFPRQLSVDTRHPETARAVLECAGSQASGLIINDVSGLLTHPEMPAAVAESGCEIVITHNRGDSVTMQDRTQYDDVVADVIDELHQVRKRYLDAGTLPERIILDPGIGFAKTHEQNWRLTRDLSRLTGLGHRVLYGASRKGFLGQLLKDEDGEPRPASERDHATAALTALAAAAGVWAVRVHAVGPSADAVRAAEAVTALEG
ncbi:dihydropteroate synthase [Nesterenkonia pannonica]|uniref:dihydropteroate synthase n=1 Tax=Nesterenkonia pannonica TaxID=1548602 RepID=UPI0021646715|nr:dihydropteroate synthase [Nesterenkonia pannonica]